ncbi:MAG TPA: hypothetical protein VK741_25510 [Acetobacteraceae bacterium]|jgi:hypothetical protein|nr:hypothetical protein [Acetobacteraceae bacterium]
MAIDPNTEAHTPLIVSAPIMARIVGLTERRLLQLAAEGMPKAGRQGYPVAAAVQWIIAYWRKRAEQTPLNDARRRKVEADASTAEIELALLRGDVARVSTMARSHGAACARVRTRMLALPTKIAPQIKRVKTVAEAEALIRREITEALEDLSGGAKEAA